MRSGRCSLLTCLLCAAVLLVACDDDPKAPPDQSTDPLDQVDAETELDELTPQCTPGEPCPDPEQVCDPQSQACVPRCTEAQCVALGLLCDPRSGFCANELSCAARTDCPSGQSCNLCRGFCIEAAQKKLCDSGANCFSDQYCDPCTGLCEARVELCDTCVFHHECGAEGQLCLDIPSSGGRFCTSRCTSLLDCETGYQCATLDGSQQCVPASGQCSNPAQCEQDLDCLAPQICRNGICSPGCVDGGCPESQVCDDGRCLPPCPERAADCPTDQLCNVSNGKCEFEGECLITRDCGQAEMYCDPQTNRCTAGCLVDDDCWDAAKECKNGGCVRRGCKGAYACAFEQICDMQPAVCVDAEGPYCDTCDPEQEGACGPEENKCIELQDKDGNSMGNFCFVACSKDPDNICPQGYQCAPLQDQDGNPAGEVCFRDCTVDPYGT